MPLIRLLPVMKSYHLATIAGNVIEDRPLPTRIWENKTVQPNERAGTHRWLSVWYRSESMACVDWKTGKQLWTERKIGNGSDGRGDKLIVASENGRLMIVQAALTFSRTFRCRSSNRSLLGTAGAVQRLYLFSKLPRKTGVWMSDGNGELSAAVRRQNSDSKGQDKQ